MWKALIVFFFAMTATLGFAEEPKDKAQKLVKDAIEFYKANGKEKAFAEINNTKGKFVEGEFYIFVFDFTGTCVSRGDGKADDIGKNLIGRKDPNGKEYIKEMINVAKDKKSGWVDYQRSNPTTKAIEDKSSYIEGHDNLLFGCGFYKK